ncbi:MAG: hypothetical protein H6713_20225 [Myxococcales bacterium]|nr:hypothetical protein [Myxococcales bacterium]MCB9752289.1 hypothetical protein [Myxococcales bacterium]
MRRSAILALTATLAAGPLLAGCEYINGARGLISAMTEIETHLEKDLAAPLTEEKLTLFLEVTPKLTAFTATAKHKWIPDPAANDLGKLASALGGLTDYMAFFESEGTRITEYYVLMIKVNDARGQILWRRAYEEAHATLERERADLESANASAGTPEEERALEKSLERNQLAMQKLETTKQEQEASFAERSAAAGNKNTYQLSAEEIALVEARLDEVNQVFKDAGYAKKDEALPVEVEQRG